jgi:hypothetical protein
MLIAVSAYTQERVNAVLPRITKHLAVLDNATGWILNPEDQWISRKNRIPAFLDPESSSLMDHEVYKLGTDNFISYHKKQIVVDGERHQLIYKLYRNGNYKYESIREGWYNYNSVKYYVVPDSALSFINTIDTGLQKFNIPVTITGQIEFLTGNVEANIIKSIAAKRTNEDEINHLKIVIKSLPKKGLVRFLLYDEEDPNDHSFGFVVLSYSYPDLVDYDKTTLQRFYYECSLTAFKTFITRD